MSLGFKRLIYEDVDSFVFSGGSFGTGRAELAIFCHHSLKIKAVCYYDLYKPRTFTPVGQMPLVCSLKGPIATILSSFWM